MEPSPLFMFVAIMAMIFIVEAAVMLALPLVTNSGTHPVVGLLVDACLLVAILCPGVWMLVVRPVRRLAQERGELLRELTASVEGERTRLAHELHDELGQIQTAILLTAKAGEQSGSIEVMHERMRTIQELASSAIGATRRLACGLSPVVLEEFGLAVAISRLAEEWNASGSVDVQVDCRLHDQRFQSDIELCVFRVVQEATVNAVRHGRAGHVQVCVEWQAGLLTIHVSDDGHGLEPRPELKAASLGMGLRGMRQRVELLGGTFAIEPMKDGGMKVVGKLPAEVIGRE